MKILVFGGTGAIGLYLCQILLQQGHHIYITSRRKRNSTDKNIHYVYGNAKNTKFIDSLGGDWDVIVDFMVYNTEEFSTRIKKLLSITKHYIYTSSARVFAESLSPITEDSLRLLDYSQDEYYLSTDEYALTKARQENILLNSETDNWTIIRPYITYGDERLQLGVLEKEEWLFRALSGRKILFCNELINKKTTITSGHDVARCISMLIERGPSATSYNLCNNYTITWGEILETYLETLERLLGKKPVVKFLPVNEFLQAFRPGDLKYQVLVDRLYDREFDNSRIGFFIDTQSFMYPKDGVSTCLENFILDPKFKCLNWKLEAKRDKLARDFANIFTIKGVKNKLKYIVFRLF